MSAAEREQQLRKRKPNNSLGIHHRTSISWVCINICCQRLVTNMHQSLVRTPDRMTECEAEILKIFNEFCISTYAWCILPNHYHAPVKTDRIKELRKELGLFNGRSSYRWNGRTMPAVARFGSIASNARSNPVALLGNDELDP